MRNLNLQFADDALPKLDAFLKETKEARLFRRAQAVREVVKGIRMQEVSNRFDFTYSAVRKWVHRFGRQGTAGLFDRPRPGQPRKVTSELQRHLDRLVDQDPLQHGSLHSQWSCQELAHVLRQQTGVQLGRETIRLALKKTR
jgi:transposase